MIARVPIVAALLVARRPRLSIPIAVVRGAIVGLFAVTFVLLPHAAAALSIETVLNSGEFGIFSAALKKSGLWERMTSENEVTLFIVPDEAMRDEGSAFLLEKVLQTKYNQQRLEDLMSYHVSLGEAVLPDQLQSEVMLSTAAGACLPLYRLGTGIRVGPEAVVTEVKLVGRGIVYVVDRLLWQPWRDEATCRQSLAGVGSRKGNASPDQRTR